MSYARRNWPAGLALAALLIAAVAVGTAIAPSPAGAVGGLSLEDRILLTGEPVLYHTQRCALPNDPLPVVPEGRRLFIYSMYFDMRPGNRAYDWRLGGRIPVRVGNVFGSTLLSRDTSNTWLRKPIVLNAGEEVTIRGYDGAGQEVALDMCLTSITQAYLM